MAKKNAQTSAAWIEERELRLSFHGADRGVTGSCHLLECVGKKILVDCGIYQGSRELDEENSEPFGFDPAQVDFVLLTHAHLDHCGRLPLLVKRGFRGEIIATAPSRELARLVLLDTAHLQEEEARSKARKAARRGADHHATRPLFTVIDALNCLDFFGRIANYGESFDLAAGIRVSFFDAGHILGSASVYLEMQEHGRHRRVLFSGDLGNAERPFLRSPTAPTNLDVVVMETTYGDRLHKALGPSVEELYSAIGDTFKRGGNVIIPTFALERAQELLFYFREGLASDRLPGTLQVFLDSPMAISATEIFKRYPEYFNETLAQSLRKGCDPFDFQGLHFIREVGDSIALNQIGGGSVIMAGSGMCTGGRVRHHLRHNLWRRESSIIFVGFAAEGTLARQLIDGAKQVAIFGEEIPVRAHIHTINGFSAHADQRELLAWHRQIGTPRHTFLVHGEAETMQHFSSKLKNTRIEMPQLHESFEL